MEEAERTEHLEWLEALPLLQEQIAVTIYKLCQADADGNPEATLEDYAEAIDRLPPVLAAMKKLPVPREKALQEAKRGYEKGLDTLLRAAHRGVALRSGELPEEQARVQLADVLFNVGVAAELIQQAVKTVNEFVNR
ncbi:MAG: hypothetical protein ACOC58_00830 [Chloroflexota bacterium]